MLQNKNFKRLLLGYGIEIFSYWVVNTMLPIWVAQKFGTGSKVVWALALLLLPQIFCAPFIGKLLLKKGPQKTVAIMLGSIAVIYCLLPHIRNYGLFQAIILLQGALQATIVASLMTLRSRCIPPGKNILGNSLFVRLDRLGQIIGPALAGLLLLKISVAQCFYGTALLAVIAMVILLKVYTPQIIVSDTQKIPSASYRYLWRLFQQKTILYPIFIPILGCAISIGAMRPFLFFSATTIFHNTENDWSFLLTAYGAGALIGGLIAPKLIRILSSAQLTLLAIFMGARILNISWLVGLVCATNFSSSMGILAIAGLFDVIGAVCYFTLIQKHLLPQEEGLFHTLSLPIFYVFVMLGTLLGELYTMHWVGLHGFWLMTIGWAILMLVPFLYHNNELTLKKA